MLRHLLKNTCGVFFLLLILLGLSSPAFALEFNMVKGSGILALESGTASEQAMAAQVVESFELAGVAWALRLEDDITVNVVIEYTSLGSNVLGQSYSETDSNSYTSVKNALGSDVATTYDYTAISNLQSSSGLKMVTNDTSSPVSSPMVEDYDHSANNMQLNICNSNAKALGLMNANSTAVDATITFSSDFDWDFDRSDGIDFDSFDFTGVTIHELGHALGFTSGVDVIDYYSAPNGGDWMDLENFAIFSVADLYRYSDYSVSLDAGLVIGDVLDLSTYNDVYMSIDGGETAIADMSTGEYNGDGYQASHWISGSQTGIMTPSTVNGQEENISHTDLIAMDVIGYDRSAASLGDFNDDGVSDDLDIDMLLDELLASSDDLIFDVSFDLTLDTSDIPALLETFVSATEADANLSGNTDIFDFLILKANYGSESAGWAMGDFTGEGTVDIFDFLYLKAHYGDSLAVSSIDYASAHVPEPASLAIFAAGSAIFIRRRRL